MNSGNWRHYGEHDCSPLSTRVESCLDVNKHPDCFDDSLLPPKSFDPIVIRLARDWTWFEGLTSKCRLWFVEK